MSDPIIRATPLGNRWQTQDPFLFCVHHVDYYPNGNDRLGRAALLAGRDLGQDFEGKDTKATQAVARWHEDREESPAGAQGKGRRVRRPWPVRVVPSPTGP
jgi:hypothetical protein